MNKENKDGIRGKMIELEVKTNNERARKKINVRVNEKCGTRRKKLG